MSIKIILSAANMGNVDEADFDLWAAYVAEKIDDLTGLSVDVDQARFGDGSPDEVRGAEPDERETVREAMHSLWESFCGEEWETRRKAHDAALRQAVQTTYGKLREILARGTRPSTRSAERSAEIAEARRAYVAACKAAGETPDSSGAFAA